MKTTMWQYILFIPLFTIVLILNLGCPDDTAVKWVVELASLPRISPVGVAATISADRQSVSFSAIMQNLGYNDPIQQFGVDMDVYTTQLHINGIQSTVSGSGHVTHDPGVTPVPGHHGTPPAGPRVSTSVIVGGMVYDPSAIYHINIVIDQSGAAFAGANAGVNNFTIDWTPK